MLKYGLLIFLLFNSVFGQENPCEPNPCGVNTRCTTQGSGVGSRQVISCKCLPGMTIGLDGQPSCSINLPSVTNYNQDSGKGILLEAAPRSPGQP